MLERFVPQLIAQMLGYFALMGVLFGVFFVWGERFFAARRVQRRKRVDGRQLRFEIGHTIGTLAVGGATAAVIAWLQANGHTRLTLDASSIGAGRIALTLIALVLGNDAWFYGWHRLLHTPRLFRWVHAVHHKSVDVNPFSSYSFHVAEAFVLQAWVIPVVVVVPLWLPALGALQAIGLANNAMSHLGYELFPRWLMKAPALRWLNTATFHNLHHTRLRGNFGLQFRLWDRVFGTELPEYERVFVERDVERDQERGVERDLEREVERDVERGVERGVERDVERDQAERRPP